jgi:hypothetical protein
LTQNVGLRSSLDIERSKNEHDWSRLEFEQRISKSCARANAFFPQVRIVARR